MNNQSHLSEEAVAACADGVLSGGASDRASRHIANCPECAHAVKVQREAAWALRAAPAPALPTGLVERLRDVPQTTPIRTVPAGLAADGTPTLPSISSPSSPFDFAPMAAFVPAAGGSTGHRNRTVAAAAAAVALAGALAAGAVMTAEHQPDVTKPAHAPADFIHQVRVTHKLGR